MKKKHNKQYYSLNCPTPPPSFLLTNKEQRQLEWQQMQYLYDVTDSSLWHVDITVTERLLAKDILDDYVSDNPVATYTSEVIVSALEITQQYKSPKDFEELLKQVTQKLAFLLRYYRSINTLTQLKRQLPSDLGPSTDE